VFFVGKKEEGEGEKGRRRIPIDQVQKETFLPPFIFKDCRVPRRKGKKKGMSR